MNFHEGDLVIHWIYGLGKVVRLEAMTLSDEQILYYAIQIGDMTIWVPADDMLETRLRQPTLEAEFTRLMRTLSYPGKTLPIDRFERKKLLLEWLKDGHCKSLFRVINSLSTYRDLHRLNDSDQELMRRTQKALLSEWSFAMSMSLAQAEYQLHRLLTSHSPPEPESKHTPELEAEVQQA